MADRATGDNKDQIVGTIFSGTSEYGFRTMNDGNTVVFSFPGAAWTFAGRINDEGEVVGFYGTTNDGPSSGYTAIRGVFTPVVFPGATETLVWGLNDAGTIVGQYTDASGVIHGFLATPQR